MAGQAIMALGSDLLTVPCPPLWRAPMRVIGRQPPFRRTIPPAEFVPGNRGAKAESTRMWRSPARQDTDIMNAQVGMEIVERARRALTRVPPSIKVTDALVADVADAIKGAVRAAYQEAALAAASRTYEGLPLDEVRIRRDEAAALARIYEKVAAGIR
jgi:hypothetical protein